MNGRKEIIYWDTCIWLAHFGNEINRKPGELEGIQEDVRRFDAEQILIATSAITWVEMFRAENRFGTRVARQLTNFFNRPELIKIAADMNVCRLASEIRTYYVVQQVTDNLPPVDFPDAIHLASAILYEATAFHTFDENDVGGSGRRAHRGLLGLSGNVAGRPLLIRKPPVPAQPSLRLVLPSEDESNDATRAAAKPKE
jgi:predicted nucleic acid-binding protein